MRLGQRTNFSKPQEIFARFGIMILVFAGMSVAADTEIYRCLLEDGTFAFQETPCPEPAESADDDNNPPTQPEATLPEPVSEDRSECEKKTRDAIDAIDLEMRQSAYTKEQGRAYLAELRALTQQLRACKQL
jgi:hypothetical protein